MGGDSARKKRKGGKKEGKKEEKKESSQIAVVLDSVRPKANTMTALKAALGEKRVLNAPEGGV